MEETDSTLQRAQARVGTLLNGRWRLDKLVGVGGMAAVYAATHRNSKRVAIKILHPEISADDGARSRFVREGYAANQVGHRGAVMADDDGVTEDGTAFLVMELLEGETLDERSTRRGGKLEVREVLSLIDQALAALEAAHEKNIVHRDLKPENLFLTREGVVKVLDFGIARLQDHLGVSPSQTQGVMGTPCFMAPEQARGRWEEVDARTDLWAIGATIFTLISGRFVHEAETANETLVAAVTERARSLATVAPQVHESVVRLVDRALSYERELRFSSASEFRVALAAADAALADGEALPPLSLPKSRNLTPLQTATVALTTDGGVASSVRAAQTSPSAKPASRARPLALGAACVVLALGIWGGRGLFSGAGKQTALAAASPAVTSLPRAEAVALQPVIPPSTSAAPVAATPVAPDPANSPVKLAVSVTHPAPAHAATNVHAVSAKPHATKPATDLLAKRH